MDIDHIERVESLHDSICRLSFERRNPKLEWSGNLRSGLTLERPKTHIVISRDVLRIKMSDQDGIEIPMSWFRGLAGRWADGVDDGPAIDRMLGVFERDRTQGVMDDERHVTIPETFVRPFRDKEERNHEHWLCSMMAMHIDTRLGHGRSTVILMAAFADADPGARVLLDVDHRVDVVAGPGAIAIAGLIRPGHGYGTIPEPTERQVTARIARGVPGHGWTRLTRRTVPGRSPHGNGMTIMRSLAEFDDLCRSKGFDPSKLFTITPKPDGPIQTMGDPA